MNILIPSSQTELHSLKEFEVGLSYLVKRKFHGNEKSVWYATHHFLVFLLEKKMSINNKQLTYRFLVLDNNEWNDSQSAGDIICLPQSDIDWWLKKYIVKKMF